MPKTKKQKIIFSVLMSFMMVYGMEFYNVSMNKGVKNAVFLLPAGELVMLMMIVVLLKRSSEDRWRESSRSGWLIRKKRSPWRLFWQYRFLQYV